MLSTGRTSLLLLAGLLAIPHGQARPLHVDPTLVRPYTFDLERLKPLPSPYVASYRRSGKLLIYVAAQHVSAIDYPNLLDHPTLRTVEKVFTQFKPQVVVVEGLPTGDELSPASMLRAAAACEANGYRTCGESFFAINQARRSGAEFITGEPTDAALCAEFVREGYDGKDLLAMYLVRQIPQMKRQGQFSRETFAQAADSYLRDARRSLGVDQAFTFDDFVAWYRTRMPKPANYLDIENNDAAPDGGPNASYVQRISNRVTLIRDRNIVRRIGQMLERYSRVMVLYGGSHQITQDPALVQMLGKGSYTKMY